MKVNNALSMYYDVGLTLTAEYQREKINHLQTQRDFERWWDEKFELCRKEILEEYADSKSIKPAVKEFETRVRTKFAEEYNDWQDKIAESEAKERFVLRLIGNLERYDKILVTIANNMRTEMRSLSVIDRASAVGGSEAEPSATRRKVT